MEIKKIESSNVSLELLIYGDKIVFRVQRNQQNYTVKASQVYELGRRSPLD
jgi:hypothetical protein